MGLLILAIGYALGVSTRSGLSGARPNDDTPGAGQIVLDRKLVLATVPDEVPDNGLETLRVELPHASAVTLQGAHDRAQRLRLIMQEEGDSVDATVTALGKQVDAEVRLKGDWLDHLAQDKWSLRVTLKGDKLFGMRTFSVQSPRTRGMLREWLVLAIGRREGVLAPRGTFVNVVLNGNALGVFYLEEHFSKEMLEAQGRREGPIVLWDEGTSWSRRLDQHKVRGTAARPGEIVDHGPAGRVIGAARAYGERRLSETESLSRMLDGALDDMRALESLLTSKRALSERMAVLKQMDELGGETLDSILNVELLARANALASVFQISHALAWHNIRFYHDPVLDRLEPILFDSMAGDETARLPVPFRANGFVLEYNNSRAYYNGVFRELGTYCRTEWLDEVFEELGPELSRYEAALIAEGTLDASSGAAALRSRLRAQQSFLRRLLYSNDAINWEAAYRLDDPGAEILAGEFEVNAWATNAIPVVVDGFRFANGTFVRAGDALVDGPERATVLPEREGRGVVLSNDNSSSRFRFPIDPRLTALTNADALKRSVRTGVDPVDSIDFDVRVEFRSIAAADVHSEALRFRRADAAWEEEGGRPAAPSLDEALALHPFLELPNEAPGLRVRPGVWDVEGDLVVPTGMTLHAGAGTTLRFDADAVLLTTSPLVFAGSAEAPVVLEPKDEAAGWRGIGVLGASGRSWVRHTVVRATDAVQRRAWVLTGGVTFYRSAVTLEDCSFEGTRAEDGLNVFGADVKMMRVVFDACESDSFDGDFISGELVDCRFVRGAADGIDLSGSDVTIERCVFEALGDKALSIGERTRCTITDCEARDVSIGVAVKDDSDVEVRGMRVAGARSYALAVFVKKPEFGPARLDATELTLQDSGLGDTLVQTGCTLNVDGRSVPAEDVDVDELYRNGVLGK